MINLRKNSGLNLQLDLDNLKLVFSDDPVRVEPAIRIISQMQEVLLDRKIDSPRELYYMYRGVKKTGDAQLMHQNNLRYDITIIRPGFLGNEFIKTLGHYHVNSYPELYEVLWGEALCLLQRPNKEDFRKIKDVILVRAKAKEKIVVLPNYGHILINPSKDIPLVTANWVSTKFNSDYSLYKEARGAAYFITNNEGEFKPIKNNFFRELPEIKTMRPVLPIEQFGLSIDRPIYSVLKTQEKLDFLNHPDKYDYRSCFVADKTLLTAILL